MMRHWRLALALIAAVSFGIALYYPISYHWAERRSHSELEQLSALRAAHMTPTPSPTAYDAPGAIESTGPLPTVAPTTAATALQTILVPTATPTPSPMATAHDAPATIESEETLPAFTPTTAATALQTALVPTTTPTLAPSPTPDRGIRAEALPYDLLEKVTLDEGAILEELREIYQINHDLVGWIHIPGTVVDYPVVQCADSAYYLDHDFYGNKNVNGQIILDSGCDPYTPSYNLVVSGHKMRNGSMFGGLTEYQRERYWREHKIVEFDTLMARRRYVVFAAFLSADYGENEQGFRYNADIRYRVDAERWLAEVRANQLYDTGIDARFGDEFLTLTTCSRGHHREGRFVLVCRRIREGEDIR